MRQGSAQLWLTRALKFAVSVALGVTLGHVLIATWQVQHPRPAQIAAPMAVQHANVAALDQPEPVKTAFHNELNLLAAVSTPEVKTDPAIPPLQLHPAFRAQVIRVHDGDTALFRLQLEAGVSVEVWVRLEGFNAPELRGPNKELAAKATQALSALLLDGQVWVRLTGDQTFARYVGRVYATTPDGPVDVSVKLTEMGYAVTQGD